MTVLSTNGSIGRDNDSAINKLNWNKVLYDKYISVIVPAIADKGDDEQHGSTVLADIAALQALSKRIHFGKFVAESKYQSNPEGFQKIVDQGDANGVMVLLTNEEVKKGRWQSQHCYHRDSSCHSGCGSGGGDANGWFCNEGEG